MSMPYTGADAEIPVPRLRTITHLWSLAAVLASLGVAALAVDAPLARWVAEGNCPYAVRKICGLSEIASNGWGVLMLAVAIAVLDPWHRYAIPRILAASWGAGVAANLVKLLVARARPAHFDLDNRGLESFGQWLPLGMNASWEQSLPSSHAATAAGLAIVLACFYPRGRWLFPVLAAAAGFQRVAVEAHFASDVLWGAAIGCIFAPLCVYGSSLAHRFDRFEERLLARTRVTGVLRPLRQGHAPATGMSPPEMPRAA